MGLARAHAVSRPVEGARRLLAGGPIEEVVPDAGNGAFAVTRRGIYSLIYTQCDAETSDLMLVEGFR